MVSSLLNGKYLVNAQSPRPVTPVAAIGVLRKQ